MTRIELFSAIRERGYEEEFIDDLKQDTTKTVNQLIRMIDSGNEKTAWHEIDRLHDEFTYFNTFDDDIIVYITNEAYLP